MGNCSCLSKSSNSDAHSEKTFNKINSQEFKRPHSASKAYDEEKIIQIQAYYRGHRARQRVYKMKLDYYKEKVIEQLHAFSESMTHNVHHRKLPPFQYQEDESDDPDFNNRVFKPATELAGGGVYVGEWYIIKIC